MTVRISVKLDLAKFALALDKAEQFILPYATAAALTDCAKAGKAAVVARMPATFDRPTPWTLNGLVVVSAKKGSLTAMVKIKDLQSSYLQLEETGGTRTPSTASGAAVKALVVPVAKNMALNKYGNIPRGFLKRLAAADAVRPLTTQQARRKKLYDEKRAKRDQGFFVLKGHGIGGHGPGGIFKRLPNHQVARIVSFQSSEHYKPRFNYRRDMQAAFKAEFNAAMHRRIAEMKVKFK